MKNVIVLGNFDGVHRGHQKLITMALDYARKNNLKCIVYTFSTLPNNKKYIMTVEEKVNAIKELGVDEVYIDDFYNIKNYMPEEFVKDILIEKLQAKKVFCGFNYTFGHNKIGNIEKLSKLIDTSVVDEIKIDDITVSSSVIRKYIEEGLLEKATELLGKPFQISGPVIHGKQLGRTIGFPTANLRLNALKISVPYGVYGAYLEIEGDKKRHLAIMNIGKPFQISGPVIHGKQLGRTIGFPTANLRLNALKISVPYGVYGAYLEIEGDKKRHLAIMNIGKNPTVNDENTVTAEANIFDFNEDIYGKKICIYLIKRIRAEKKFKNLIELKKQITTDKDLWRSIASASNKN